MPGNERGGRRPGAGRKPGDHATSKNGAMVLRATDGPITSTSVDPWILSVCGFLAIGLSISEIARRLHRTRVTIRRVRDTYPELILDAVQRLTNPNAVFSPMLPAAAATYHTALKRADTSVARDVMDRLYGKPVVREQRLERREVHITFVDATDQGE